MRADNTISYITGSLESMGVLAFFVAVIVQTSKRTACFKKSSHKRRGSWCFPLSFVLFPCWHSALIQEKALPGILSVRL